MGQNLREDNLFRLSFEHSSCGKLITDINGKIVKVNKAFCKLLNLTEDKLLNKNEDDFITKDKISENVTQIDKLKSNSATNVHYSSQYKTSAFEYVNIDINAIAIHNEENSEEPNYILKQIELVSDKQELKKELNKKEFFLRKIMDEMPANIYFKDLNSKYILVNRAMAKTYGEKSVDGIIGKSDFDYYDEKFAKNSYESDQEIIETGKPFEESVMETWKDGTSTWSHTAKMPLHNDLGELIGVFGISKDITNLRKIREDLQEAHNEVSRKNKDLNATLKSLKEAQSSLVNAEKLAALGQLIAGIAHEVNTPLGAINASNSNIKSSFGLLIENIDNNITNFTPVEIELLKRLLDNYKSNIKTQLSSKEKRTIKKEMTNKLVMQGIANGSKIADIIIYLNQSKYFESITTYSKDVNLLNVLVASKNMISVIKNTENIETAINKASSVVLALKKYIHKTHDGTKSRTDIADNIETVITLNHNKIKQGIELVQNYDTIPLIEAYPDELSQIWNNIITNSIHAMDNKGTLTIDIINGENDIFIKFTDTGCGIPDEIKDKIFTPFFTTKISGEGTGLGLDIIKRIIEKHDGKLSLESTIDVGTTFTVQLPKK